MKEDLKWFDLKKYYGVHEFTHLDWFVHLNHRQKLFQLVESKSKNILTFGDEKKDLDKNYLNKFNLIKESPLEIDAINHGKYSSIRDATFFDLCKVVQYNPKHDNYPDLSVIAQLLGLTEISKKENEKYTPKSISYGYLFERHLLSLNLSKPDHQLLDDFKRWLLDVRKKRGKKPIRCTEKKLNMWEKNKVLPYLDLTLIAKLESIDLKQYEIGGYLFPDDDKLDITEKIRKVVKPLAEQLLKDESISTLRSQI